MKNCTLLFLIISLSGCFTYIPAPDNQGTRTTSSPSRNVNPYIEKYANKLDVGSNLIDADKYYSYEKTQDGKYVIKYYLDLDLSIQIAQETYLDENMNSKEGMATYWDFEGNKSSEGEYKSNLKEGEWKNYYSNGTVYKTTNFKAGNKEGMLTEYSENGNKISEYTYQNDLREGPFNEWTDEKELAKTGTYKEGKMFKLETLIDENRAKTYKVVEEMPNFPGCWDIAEEMARKQCAQKKMLVYIYKNVSYPRIARKKGEEGTAVIPFIVDTDGMIRNIEVARINNSTYDLEAFRVVNTMNMMEERWEPGLFKGEKVKVQFNLPVKFRLE